MKCRSKNDLDLWTVLEKFWNCKILLSQLPANALLWVNNTIINAHIYCLLKNENTNFPHNFFSIPAGLFLVQKVFNDPTKTFRLSLEWINDPRDSPVFAWVRVKERDREHINYPNPGREREKKSKRERERKKTKIKEIERNINDPNPGRKRERERRSEWDGERERK